ncbi:MAG: phosphonate metabolism protein/1,5-bisphosphokinase (PRPP-forming) PhnN, partial [Bacteroidota bacterium]|nr:phosphonate metabolism protein/1,5-bisphosphokinase (PRPP-forming) PhnN [Bacteroidota bacterium]
MAKIFYVIGSSGVGKDSIMIYAKKKISGSSKVLFAHRYITRPADVGEENHISLTKEEYKVMLNGNLFVFNWESHDLHYGIGIEINFWVNQGFNVVISGSREYLKVAQDKKENMQVIMITAKPANIEKRLLQRGRESPEEINNRIQRNKEMDVDHNNIIKISNNGA